MHVTVDQCCTTIQCTCAAPPRAQCAITTAHLSQCTCTAVTAPWYSHSVCQAIARGGSVALDPPTHTQRTHATTTTPPLDMYTVIVRGVLADQGVPELQQATGTWRVRWPYISCAWHLRRTQRSRGVIHTCSTWPCAGPGASSSSRTWQSSRCRLRRAGVARSRRSTGAGAGTTM
jgi:hypothetical protein